MCQSTSRAFQTFKPLSICGIEQGSREVSPGSSERQRGKDCTTFGSQDSESRWEGLGEAINHSRSMGSTGDFSSSFSPSFPSYLLEPLYPPSQPSPLSHKDPCRMLREAFFFIPHPAVAPQGWGNGWRGQQRMPWRFWGGSPVFSQERRLVLLFPLPSCGTGVTVSPPAPAAATLIPFKLAVLEEVTTLGQPCSPWLRDDAGNH